MKKIFLSTLLLISFQTFAYTNAEVKCYSNRVIDLMTVPMEV